MRFSSGLLGLWMVRRRRIAPPLQITAIAAQYGFDALPAALDHLERGAFGKIVITL
jgi:hypothetical protein